MVREPLVRAVASLTAVVWLVLAAMSGFDIDWRMAGSILFAMVVSFICAAVLTLLYFGDVRAGKIVGLQGETLRGMISPIGKVPQHRPPLPCATDEVLTWFDVPEIAKAQAKSGLFPVAFWNAWCEKNGFGSPHVRLARRILLTLGAKPDFPAGTDPTHHGGRSLLSHSLLVAFLCMQQRHTYEYKEGCEKTPLADKKFTFAAHRESPLIMLVGLAHDIGKLTSFVPDPDKPGHYMVDKLEHDREGIVILARLDEWWELTTADRDTLTAVVGHYHAESRMPVTRKGRAIDDMRHALVYLLIGADNVAGQREALSVASKQASASATAALRNAGAITAPPSPPPVKSGVAAYPMLPSLPPLPWEDDAGAHRADAALVKDAPPPVATAASAAAELEARIDALAAADTPREIRTASTRVLQAGVALNTLSGNNPLLDLALLVLREPGRINAGDDKNIAVRNDDHQFGAKLLVIVEASLRGVISNHPLCPRQFSREGGRFQQNGRMSPLTQELLAAFYTCGWLWQPHNGSTENANRNALYKGFGNTASRLYADRSTGEINPGAEAAAKWKPGAIFFLRVDHDSELSDIAELPEYGKCLVAGPSIFGARGRPAFGAKKTADADDVSINIAPPPMAPAAASAADARGVGTPPNPQGAPNLSLDFLNDFQTKSTKQEAYSSPTEPTPVAADQALLSIHAKLVHQIHVGTGLDVDEGNSSKDYFAAPLLQIERVLGMGDVIAHVSALSMHTKSPLFRFDRRDSGLLLIAKSNQHQEEARYEQ